MSAALAMLLFCNYSEQYSQNRIFDAFFLLIQAASPKKYERMLLQMQAFDEHPLIFLVSESLLYFFKASSAACMASSYPLFI